MADHTKRPRRTRRRQTASSSSSCWMDPTDPTGVDSMGSGFSQSSKKSCAIPAPGTNPRFSKVSVGAESNLSPLAENTLDTDAEIPTRERRLSRQDRVPGPAVGIRSGRFFATVMMYLLVPSGSLYHRVPRLLVYSSVAGYHIHWCSHDRNARLGSKSEKWVKVGA